MGGRGIDSHAGRRRAAHTSAGAGLEAKVPGPGAAPAASSDKGGRAASLFATSAQAATTHRRRRNALALAGLVALLAAAFALSLAIGRYDVDFGAVLAFFASPFTGQVVDASSANVFLTIRLPRLVAALIVGAALSGAGCAFQGIFKNPMASPDLLGASAGACFGAALGILLSFGSAGMELCAFACGVIAVATAYALSTTIGRRMGGVLVLVLSGMVAGQAFPGVHIGGQIPGRS